MTDPRMFATGDDPGDLANLTGLERDEKAGRPSPDLRRVRALLVDDQQDTRELSAMLLRRSDAVVYAVGSAEAARKVLNTTEVDVLVSDLSMPGEDGFELMASVRRRELELGIDRLPALAVTALARQADRERAEAAGFDAYLTKPVNPWLFLRTVAGLASPSDRTTDAGTAVD